MKIIVRASFEVTAKLELSEKALSNVQKPSGAGYNPNTRLRNIQWECTSKYSAKKIVAAIMLHSPRSLTFADESETV
jgi:hypothetical protein